jgi:hypothetical protein
MCSHTTRRSKVVPHARSDVPPIYQVRLTRRDTFGAMMMDISMTSGQEGGVVIVRIDICLKNLNSHSNSISSTSTLTSGVPPSIYIPHPSPLPPVPCLVLCPCGGGEYQLLQTIELNCNYSPFPEGSRRSSHLSELQHMRFPESRGLPSTGSPCATATEPKR